MRFLRRFAVCLPALGAFGLQAGCFYGTHCYDRWCAEEWTIESTRATGSVEASVGGEPFTASIGASGGVWQCAPRSSFGGFAGESNGGFASFKCTRADGRWLTVQATIGDLIRRGEGTIDPAGLQPVVHYRDACAKDSPCGDIVAGCYDWKLPAGAVAATIEHATGGAAPAPSIVTDDFLRILRLDVNVPDVRGTITNGPACKDTARVTATPDFVEGLIKLYAWSSPTPPPGRNFGYAVLCRDLRCP